MKIPKDSGRRGLLPGITFVAACLFCLGTGFYTGKMYSSNAGGSSVVVPSGSGVRAVRMGSSSSSSAAKTLGAKGKPDPELLAKKLGTGKPYYTQGVTRHLAPQHLKPLCTNTCKKAKDGVCDDGRFKPGAQKDTSVRKVFCDLGTDCDDCGPWEPSGDVPWASGGPGPVARLLAKGVEVRVKRAAVAPYFDFAYTDPAKDFDVSGWMENSGAVEASISKIFYQIFKEKCKADPRKPGLFVDVGSNFGWFAVMGAAMGCRVLAFEPVPTFHAFLEFSVHLNGLAQAVDMRSNVVSAQSGAVLEMVVPTKGIWGTASIGGYNIDQAVKGSANEKIQVPSQTLDELVDDDVLLMKVDVEGWEWSVMQGAAGLMAQRTVENIIMEYSPGVPERHFQHDQLKATVQMLVNIVDNGLRIAHIGDAGKHGAAAMEGQLDEMEEVTRHTLMYDLLDVQLFQEGKLGCPMPEALSGPHPAWSLCNALPEDANPHSLRSLIGHNTNLWASRNPKLQRLKGVVGLLPVDVPHTQWFLNPGTELGQGSRPCAQLAPAVQVRHRCPCTEPDKCGKEEAAAKEAALAGIIPSNYKLTPDGRPVHVTGAVKEVLERLGSAEAVGLQYRPGKWSGPKDVATVDSAQSTI
uniref:Methyltransferase FkbM domain-containing protein n=1 Tax=Chlamydomonas leiostraca TaxID=1034604 RepID=A0A7S0RP63_9CHLO|mmetsp:Transcript_27924/g.71211  ORF Transcript_27924/g.71211 Transcript_27924/m.71211 type:complete len:634 (+) Transcript_27924:57-1958(+)